ncbi:N-acetyltransferase [candidate division KSB1 bacterium]|nr:MAG: N-acetyltransferase [candidate division KSB1 bacterium]
MIDIRPLQNSEEVHACAQTMATSDPWLTLGRGYEECRNILSDAAKETYVAYGNDRLAGFIILNLQGAFRGYIQTVCVMPDWRGQGVGSELIKFAEARIFRDFPNVFMCVSSFNPNAQKLYVRLGYEIIGELKDYIVAGHSEILLRKTIGPMAEFQKQTMA